MSTQKTNQPLDNIVYILGAGFSAPLGIPVMSNFLEKSKDLFAADPDKYRGFERVFKTIDKMFKSKGYYNTNLFNIEEILSILEMNEELGDETERSLFVNYILDVIQAYTPTHQPTPHDFLMGNWRRAAFGTDTLNYYGYFAASLLNLVIAKQANGSEIFCNYSGDNNRAARYSVITVNYDMILENCFSYLQKMFHAEDTLGFSHEIENNKEKFMHTTHLAKLHGSVHTRTIVPPTWNKGLYKSIKPAWQLAYKLLATANQIRIIGYSLPIADAYIKYLLKAAIIDCDHLRNIDVLCLDPDNSVKKRYDEFISFPNYRFIRGGTKSYLEENHELCLRGEHFAAMHMNSLERAHSKFFAE